jgi:hypothetical protein
MAQHSNGIEKAKLSSRIWGGNSGVQRSDGEVFGIFSEQLRLYIMPSEQSVVEPCHLSYQADAEQLIRVTV